MPFTPSETPDITESIPATIAARELSRRYEPQGRSADVAIGELPFRLGISDRRPAQRESAPIRKQQFDSSREPGEQTLEQSYWLRSQASWHRGAGITFYEPGVEEETQYRFAEAVGIDPWTVGAVTLLKRMSAVGVAATVNPQVSTAVVGGEDRAVLTYGDRLRTIKSDGTLTAEVTVGAGATRAAVFGGTAWVGHAEGVSSVDLATGTVTSRYTGVVSPDVYWAKSRLFATSGPAVYELEPMKTPAAVVPTALFTHPLPDWKWTSVVEAPGAVLLAGYAGGNGGIYKMILEDDGTATPRLGPPIQVAEFPPGEEVHAIRVYLGSYIAIGTTRGIRVGLVDTTGAVQYGPLTVETAKPVRSLAARDSFIYGVVEDAIDGKSGAVRINLGEEITPLRFAWSWDAQTKVVGRPNSLAFVGTTDQVAIALNAVGIYLQSATLFEPEGRLVSGAIRYGTGEPKSYRLARLRVRFPGLAGKVVLQSRSASGADSTALTYSMDVNPDEDISLQLPVPAEYISLRVDLQASPDGLATPVLQSVILKALPSPRRQRLVSYPLMCFDSEKDRFGNTVGAANSGYGWKRYAALEALEESGLVVQVRDFTNGETFSAQIESISLNRTTSPEGNNSNVGGVATVVLRKLS